jgi:hypothetical protein
MSEQKPNLFIVGAPKCGTTAWTDYLRTHPDVFFPATKDECFFALDLPRFRLVKRRSDYAAQFAGAQDVPVVGEASAMYLFSKAAAEEIRKFNPKAKILIFLREQEDYLPSLHNQFLREFAEEIEDFETAWRRSGHRPPETIPSTCLEPGTLDYAAMGRFDEQVARYLDAFPPEQICVIRFEEWLANPRAEYLRILEFIGLPDDGRANFPPVNRGTTYRSRAFARWIIKPPPMLQWIWHRLKGFTGPFGDSLYRSVRAMGFRSDAGYRNDISSDLRAEIRGYFADDNDRLNARLRDHASSYGDNRAKLAST